MWSPKNACVVDQFCHGTFPLTIHQVEVTKYTYCSMITDVLPFVYVTMKMGVTLKYECGPTLINLHV